MLKKIVYSLLALAVVSMPLHAEPRRVILDKVVAVVGNSSIFYSEVKVNADRLVEERRAEGYTSDRDPMNEVLESLMEQRLLSNQGRLDSVYVNYISINSSVMEHVNAMVNEAGGIAELERQEGMKLFNIRENLRSKYEEQSFAQSMRSDVISGITVVPGEVELFYKNMKDEDVPLIGDQYSYAQITKFPSSIDAAKRRVRERLLEMRERVIKGEAKFSILAQMYSADPGSAYRG